MSRTLYFLFPLLLSSFIVQGETGEFVFSPGNGMSLAYRLHTPEKSDSTSRLPCILLLSSTPGAPEAAQDALREIAWRIFLSDSLKEKAVILEPRPSLPRSISGVKSHRFLKSPDALTRQAMRLLSSLTKKGFIDEDRIYVMGFSSPQLGVWDLITRYPDHFAAALPIGEGGDPDMAYRLREMRLWMHYGSRDMAAALTENGIEYQETTSKFFDAWADTEHLSEEIQWLFSQKRTAEQSAYWALLRQKEGITASRSLQFQREGFHIYLLIGQSNMAGRGRVRSTDKTPHPRVLSFDRGGTWIPAREPLHWDRRNAGVGPGLSFAKYLADRDSTITIGLVPSAVGETTIEDWLKDSPREIGRSGANCFWNAVQRTQKGLAQGVLRGILWHHGESNNFPGGEDGYEQHLVTIIQDFRDQLQSPGVPFILGEIAESDRSRTKGNNRINSINNTVAKRVPFTGCASSAALKPQLHFRTEDYRTLGIRYARELLKIRDEGDVVSKKDAAWER